MSMLQAFGQFQTEVQRGIDGKVIQLPLQQAKMAKNIALSKRNYILVGGIPGSGKTAIVDTIFVLEIYRWWQANRHLTDVKPFWIYRSMERSKHYKIAKWTSYLLWKDHGILIDVPTLLGWTSKKYDLTQENKKLIDSYKPFFEEFDDYCKVIDGTAHPTKILHEAQKYAHEKGVTDKSDPNQWVYKPHNENEIVMHVTDHVGKIRQEENLTDKGILDRHSEYMGGLRDFQGWSIIDIMQLNRSIENSYRQVNLGVDVMPGDFKGTGDIYENADTVLGLLNPYKLKAFDHMGYNIPRFVNENGYNRFRSLKCIKNSFGIDDFRIGYLFMGENGNMVELPKATDMDSAMYDHYMNLNFRTNG
jgi:hypothetical protein